MKVSVTQANLHKALSVVGKIVGSRSTLPVLSNVLVQTDANRLKLSSTNLEIGINTWIGAKVESTGSLTVPARLLADYVSSLADGNIDLSQEKQTLHIVSPQAQSHINGIDAKEFPSIPGFKKSTLLKIDATTLKDALAQVVGAASFDDTRPILNGVYFYNEKTALTIAATDSYRLAEKTLTLPTAPKEQLKIIVPARTTQELLRMLDNESGLVEIVAEENQVLFRFNDTELISRLIDGEYPNYQQLIPTDILTTIEIPTKELRSITKLAALFARESGGSVTLSADAKSQKLEIKATASQVGDSSSVAVASVSGEDATISLNSRYLLDALASLNSENMKIEITGKVNPCLLRPIDKQGDYLHLIMPLRG